MLPIDSFNEKEMQVVRSAGYDPDKFDAVLSMDMVSDLQFGHVCLALDFEDCVLFRIGTDGVETFSLTELADPYIESLTTTNRLVVYTKQGDSYILGCATNAVKDKLYAFLAVWNKMKNGESVAEDDPLFEPFHQRCPKCGRPYADRHHRTCEFCDRKKGVLRRMMTYFFAFRKQNIAIFFCIALSSAISLVTPLINGQLFFDQVITAPTYNEAGEQITGKLHELRYVYLFVFLLIGLAVMRILIGIVQSRANVSMSTRVAKQMQTDVFAAMQRQSLSYFNERPTGRLMSMVSYDANRIRSFFEGQVPYLIFCVINLIGMTVFLLLINWKLTLMIYIPVPIVFFIFKARLPLLWRSRSHEWRRTSRLNAMLGDSLNGIRVVKSFSKENDEYQRFYTLSQKVAKANLHANLIGLTIFPVTTMLIGMAHQAIWGVGGLNVMNATMTYGELMTYLGYVGMVFEPLIFFSTFVNQVSDVANAASRMCETLDAVPDVREDASPVKADTLRGDICFSQVYFHYNANRPILKDVSFTIHAGQHVGLVGHTGSGKSTIANLITRMYDTVSGTVSIDGVNVRRYAQESLRRNVAIVSQEIFLFGGTIADNIRYARPEATLEEVIAAARAANAHDFIMRLPEGYETRVGSGSRTLSGGERQRISIARALLLAPSILILDEATAAMDTETERLISDAIDRLIVGKTTISIAHRLSTLKNCDTIMAIEDGQLAEMGTVDELMEKQGVYYQLYTLQQGQLQKVMSGT